MLTRAGFTLAGKGLRSLLVALAGAATACDGNTTVYLGHQVAEVSSDTTGSGEGGAASTDGASSDATSSETAASTTQSDASTPPTANADASVLGPGGCGRAQEGGIQTLRLTSNGEARTAQISVPESYDPLRPYPLILGFHARNGTGLAARDDLQLETVPPAGWALFLYPDALVREFNGNDVAAGWQNGPTTTHFGGSLDLEFTRSLITEVKDLFCVDDDAVFATGYGWGGDFSAMLGCYAGDLLRGIAPVAANDPYFLPLAEGDTPPCQGRVASWVFHGVGDVEFPLQYGVAQTNFWLLRNSCSQSFETIVPNGARSDDECGRFQCSGDAVGYCWYSAVDGHNVPKAIYAPLTTGFFRELLGL